MIGETSVECEMPETLADRLRWARATDEEDALTNGGWSVNGAVVTPPEDRPVRIRITLCGIKLAFYHASRPLPPFKLTIPHGQWAKMVELIEKTAPRVSGFEAFVGFTSESLALHQIDAVEAEL
jgi:hypothetical protein